MPAALVDLYLRELPRLRAGELIQGMHQIAVGTGSLTKEDADRIRYQWRAEARGKVLKRIKQNVDPVEELKQFSAIEIVDLRKNA